MKYRSKQIYQYRYYQQEPGGRTRDNKPPKLVLAQIAQRDPASGTSQRLPKNNEGNASEMSEDVWSKSAMETATQTRTPSFLVSSHCWDDS